MQSYASAGTGAALSRDLATPWIVNLGDPWALDEMMVYPSRSHVHLVEALNRLVAGDPALEHVLELHLAGVMTEADRSVVTTRAP